MDLIPEVRMPSSALAFSSPAITPAVQAFADEKGLSRYLSAVIDLARQAFSASTLEVSLGYDAEDEAHQYIAVDVEAGGKSTEELLAGQRRWSAGISQVCPSRYAVYFVLGWR